MPSSNISASIARTLAFAGLIIVTLLPKVFSFSVNPINLIPICAIQGTGFTSPFVGQFVRTRGLVVADFDQSSRRGFFLQAQSCDGDSSTSDGIFVYLGERSEVVNTGDEVEISGTVQEYYGLTEIRTAAADIHILSSGNSLPDPFSLNPPLDDSAARQYFESRESMYVGVDEAQVVGPTDDNDRSWIVRAALGIQRVFQEDPGGTGEVICVDDGGSYEISPEVRVGERVYGLRGALDYSFGLYCLQLTVAPVVVPASELSILQQNQEWTTDPQVDFRVATFNLANLFDTVDDPDTKDSVLSPTEYQRRLQKHALMIHLGIGEPEILALQEVENLDVLQELIARPEIAASYHPILQKGPDRRGINLALLYRADRVRLVHQESRQGCTSLVDGLGPDGNGYPTSPQNSITCDTDGDGQADGNRLFSRPPLVVRLQVCRSTCPTDNGGLVDPVEIWLVVNHFKSKTEDTDMNQYTLPRRTAQAHFIIDFIEEIWSLHPDANLIVLGDLNDTLYSPTLNVLTSGKLINLSSRIQESERYTYIYHGVSQVLDHMLIRLQPQLAAISISPVHYNADYPTQLSGVTGSLYRSSDHDPLVARFRMSGWFTYLPLILGTGY